MKKLCILLVLFSSVSFGQSLWTLESSIQQVLKVSPIMGAADAQVKSSEGRFNQSGAWPNPVVELTGSNKLGINEDIGGNDLTQIAVTQAIVLGRLSDERRGADAELQAARSELIHQQLIVENAMAKAFHKLQINVAKFKLAQEQAEFADRYQQGTRGLDPLVRYMSPLEKKRLVIVRELANQKVAVAEGELIEAQSDFKTFLQLGEQKVFETEALSPPQKKYDLAELQNKQVDHAALVAMTRKQEVASAAVELAKSKRVPDLNVTLFRELDYLNNQRQHFTGITLGFTLPLWDLNSGEITRARAEGTKVKFEKQALETDLSSKLQQTYTHAGRLIEQAESYRSRILGPAEEVFKLTNSSFRAGEVNVLSLIDASNTYFDARERYLELLYETWVELAELRLAAGISLLDSNKTGGKL